MTDDADDRKRLSRTQRRLIEKSAEIAAELPDKPDYLHAVLCQVGMPRKRHEGDSFERARAC